MSPLFMISAACAATALALPFVFRLFSGAAASRS
jgi:hypothetical protein